MRFLLLSFLGLIGFSLGSDLFHDGLHAVYHYKGHLRTGVTKPTPYGNFWEIEGHLHLHGSSEGLVIFKLDDVHVGTYLGEINKTDIHSPDPLQPVPAEEKEILEKPWAVRYRKGLVTELDFGADGEKDVEIGNFKRSIASLLQIDFEGVKEDSIHVWNAKEETIFGTCTASYTSIKNDHLPNEIHVKKFIDHTHCKNQPFFVVTSLPKATCLQEKTEKSSNSQRLYVLSHQKDKLTELQLDRVEGTGANLFLPFRNYGNVKYIYTTQKLKLEKWTHGVENEVTFTSGTKSSLIYQSFKKKSFKKELAIELLESFVSVGSINAKVEKDGNIFNLLSLKNMLIDLNKDELIGFYEEVSKKGKTYREIIGNVISFLGTKTSLEVVINEFVHTRTGWVKRAVQEIIDPKEDYIDLFTESILTDIRANLPLSILIGRICEHECNIDILNKWTNIFFSKFKEAETYKEQTIFLSALHNIRSPNLIELLSPVIRENSNRNLRYYAADALHHLVHTKPKEIYDLFWPIFINKSEYIELRISALGFLVASDPTPGRLLQIHWFMDHQKEPQLYNFFHSLLENLLESQNPCYTNIKNAAQHIESYIKKPSSTNWGTSLEMDDYIDEEIGYGKFSRLLSIATSDRLWPNLFVFNEEQVGLGHVLEHTTVTLRGDGIFEKILEHEKRPTLENVLESLKRLSVDVKQNKTLYLEIVIKTYNQIVLFERISGEDIASLPEEFIKGLFSEKASDTFDLLYRHWNLENIMVSDMGTFVKNRQDYFTIHSFYYDFKGTHEKEIGINDFFSKMRLMGLKTDTLITVNPIQNLIHGVTNTFISKVEIPFNSTLKFWSDENNHESVLDLVLHNTKDNAIIFDVQSNTTTFIIEYDHQLIDSCPHSKNFVNVPYSSEVDVEDESSEVELEELGVNLVVNVRSVNFFDSEIFEQIFTSITEDSRILGYKGSPFNLFNYLSRHGFIVNLAKNSRVSFKIEFIADTQLHFNLKVPTTEKDLHHITNSLEYRIMPEKKNIFKIQTDVISDYEMIKMNVHYQSYIDNLEKCILLKYNNPNPDPFTLKFVYTDDCTFEEQAPRLDFEMTESWSPQQKHDEIWPLELCGSYASLLDWYMDLNEYDNICIEFWKDQTHNYTMKLEPLVDKEIIFEITDENKVNLYYTGRKLKYYDVLQDIVTDMYELFEDSDIYGLQTECIANVHSLITWDNAQVNVSAPLVECYHLLAADLSPEPQYAIWSKQIDPAKTLLSLKVYSSGVMIEVVPKGNGEFEVYNVTDPQNRQEMPLKGVFSSFHLQNRRGHLIIYLDNLYILTNGHYAYLIGDYMLWRHVDGLCGTFNGNPFDDFHTKSFKDCKL